METNVFAFVPIEVIQDKRLTFEQTKVLIALFSFRGKNTNTVWPSRDAISERCGIHISNISHATKSLVELGWVSKDGNGGFSKSSRYTLTVPDVVPKTKSEASNFETVAQQATIAQQATVAESARGGVAQQATNTLAQQARGKELTNELTSELTIGDKSPVKAKPIKKPDDVEDQTWADFKKIRAAKRAPLTQTAWDLMKKEIHRAGYTNEQALQVCCERGWQGFKAAWVAKDSMQGASPSGRPLNKQEALEARNRAVGDEWVAEMKARLGAQNAD